MPTRPIVLLIDDSPDLIALLREVLSDHDIDSLAVTSPERALSLLDDGAPPPHLIAMNLDLPPVEGRHLWSHLRARDLGNAAVFGYGSGTTALGKAVVSYVRALPTA
jgi:DNA-binding response OmpR family regulator